VATVARDLPMLISVMVMVDTLANGTETMDMVALDYGELIVAKDRLMLISVMVMVDILVNGTETMDMVALDCGELIVVRDLLMPATGMVVVMVATEDTDEDMEVMEVDMVVTEVVMDTESKKTKSLNLETT